jgi:hypothetical protein
MGFEVFRSLYYKLVASFKNIEPDFHRWKSMIFDGTTGSMPDTRENIEKFGKPTCGTGEAAYPCLRMVTLIAASVRLILDVAYAPYCGKGTGERSLMMKIIDRLKGADFLFLLDRGLYAFNLLKKITEKGFDFIVKVPATVKNIKIIKKLPDGSFLAEITKKVRDVDAPKNKRGKHPWKTITMTVRIIRFEIPGFRPTWIMTSILDPKVTAKEIILHYHKRWDIEIAYDEIKTHQCATLTGHPHTTFRSKKPELVQQELYAILIMYNLVRNIIAKAAYEHNKDPRFISFLDSLHHMINATPMMTAAPENSQEKFAYLLTLIADSEIDRPRRNRINPRVIKVKSSKFKRKNKKHKGKYRNIKNEIRIISDDKIIQNKVKYYQIK